MQWTETTVVPYFYKLNYLHIRADLSYSNKFTYIALQIFDVYFWKICWFYNLNTSNIHP